MKKRIRDIVIAVIVLAVICVVFWNIEWISSWKEVAFLYAILVIVHMAVANGSWCGVQRQ